MHPEGLPVVTSHVKYSHLTGFLWTLQEYGELPPFDLPSTLADISASRGVLGFSPRVGVEEGLREFVRWFKEYKLLRSRDQEAQRNRMLE